MGQYSNLTVLRNRKPGLRVLRFRSSPWRPPHACTVCMHRMHRMHAPHACTACIPCMHAPHACTGRMHIRIACSHRMLDFSHSDTRGGGPGRSGLHTGRSWPSIGRSGLHIGRSELHIGRSALHIGRSRPPIGRSGLHIGRSGLHIGRSGSPINRSELLSFFQSQVDSTSVFSRGPGTSSPLP